VAITGHIYGRVLATLADSIRASWKAFQAKDSTKGFDKFNKLWRQGFGDFFVTTDTIGPPARLFERDGQGPLPDKNIYRLSRLFSPS
jgi:hypothetical protein